MRDSKLNTIMERLICEKREEDPEGYWALKVLKLSLDNAPGWEFLRDSKSGAYLYVSSEVKTITGYDPQEFYEDPDITSKIIHPGFRKLWDNHQHRQMACGEKMFMEFKIVTKDGEERWINHFCERLREIGSGIDLIRSTNMDISRIKLRESLIKKEANTDSLTGLFNRRFITDETLRELCRSTDWGYNHVAMGDIDNFKYVNDTYGHEAGDEVLKSVAMTIRRNLREGDIAVRWGGEEFLILLHDMSDTTAGDVVDRLRSEIEEASILYQGKELKITMSFGVCRCKDKNDFVQSAKEADNRLYKAKQDGKNRVVTAP